MDYRMLLQCQHSMFENFEIYITAKGSFSKDELQFMQSLSVSRRLGRHQFLLQEGELCNTKTFVTKGLLRAYLLKDDGTEHIMRFATENNWMIDHESYTFQTPSRYYIEALEDTEVISWTKENIDMLFDAIPAFKKISDQLKEKSMNESQNRILANISYSAEEKYKAFIAANENVFRRVPLHMVASYLGVSRETLSRVRHLEYSCKKNKVG